MEYGNDEIVVPGANVSATVTMSGRDLDGLLSGIISKLLDGKLMLSMAVMQNLLKEVADRVNAATDEKIKAAMEELAERSAERLATAIEANDRKRMETPPTIENHGLISRAETENILHSSYATVYKLLKNGTLDPVYLGRKLYFRREQVEDVLRNGFTGGKRRVHARKSVEQKGESLQQFSFFHNS